MRSPRAGASSPGVSTAKVAGPLIAIDKKEMWFLVLHAMKSTPGLEKSFEVRLHPCVLQLYARSLIRSPMLKVMSEELRQKGLLPEKHSWEGTTRTCSYAELVQKHPHVPDWALHGMLTKAAPEMPGQTRHPDSWPHALLEDVLLPEREHHCE